MGFLVFEGRRLVEISGQGRRIQAYNTAMDDTRIDGPFGPLAGIRRIAVYAASSRALHEDYHEAARRLGSLLAGAGMQIVYGGGGTGLMGAVADGALTAGGYVHGIVPELLVELEATHPGLSRLDVVEDMRIRKQRMLEGADAVVALPGGCGTYEELMEAMTMKRLGQWTGPIVVVNTRGFYDRLIGFLEYSVSERFMGEEHARMWSVISEPEEVLDALGNAHAWSSDALRFANVLA